MVAFRKWAPAVVLALALAAAAAEPAKQTEPDNGGPFQVVTASWLGGPFDDELVAADIAPDLTVVLAGNGVDPKFAGVEPTVFGKLGELKDAAPPPPDPKNQKSSPWRHPSTHGFIVRLSPDGTRVLSHSRFGYGAAVIKRMKLDAEGNIYVLGDADDKGTFLAALSPDGGKLRHAIWHPGLLDFGIDGNGEVVVLTGDRLTRYAADGKAQKWAATWEAHGDNRPGAVAVSPQTGVAAVVGYGMTSTGKEPYKDPYAYGFDRDGKEVWALWNPDPKKEQATKYQGNGLTADTTGHAAAVDPGGRLLLMLYADGGNSVCTRDPLDPDKPLSPAVLEGVYQKTPGHGFKGASKTSVIFRVDPEKGELEKGTWMCAWLTRAQANGLGIEAAAADDKGRQFVVGGSAAGCPTEKPWYACKPGGHKGGGFLAVFDRDFKLQQCGYFPGGGIRAVGARDGRVVLAGSATEYEDAEAGVPVRVYKPLQPVFGGGAKDGYFVLLKAGDH
jgi:hypothetical protein